MECFTVDFSHLVQMSKLPFGWPAGYLPSNLCISEIFLKFLTFLRLYIWNCSATREATLVHSLSGDYKQVPFHLLSGKLCSTWRNLQIFCRMVWTIQNKISRKPVSGRSRIAVRSSIAWRLVALVLLKTAWVLINRYPSTSIFLGFFGIQENVLN